MGNYLKTSRIKALTLALAFIVAAVFMLVMNTDKSFAKEPIYLNNPKVAVEVPKVGTEIKKVSTREQDPAPNITIDEENPVYETYGDFWSSVSDDWSYANLFDGTVNSDSPLYLAFSLACYNEEYGFPYTPDSEDPYYGEYTGTITLNGKKAEITYAEVWDYGMYLNAVVKVMPEGDEPTPTPTPTPTPSASAPLLAKMTSKGANAISFSWDKVAGATGYEIYLSRCNYRGKEFTPKKVKTIKGNKTTKWTKKGLKKGVPYKGYVKAYKMENGKKTYISKTPTVHVFTNGGSKKYTNPKSVSVKKTSVSLAAGKTFKIKASVKKLKAGKKLLNTKHAPKLRYVSSDKNVATVNGSGTITAKAAGKCKVYAIAANGAKKAIAVTVR